jgi:putative ABC transport system permease protein
VWEICASLEKIPGVESVAFGNSMPLGDDMDLTGAAFEGRVFAAHEYPMVHARGVGPNYFQFLRVPLMEGRQFNKWDDERAPKVVVVNAAMARRYWPNESPVGQRIRPDLFQDKEWRTIIGVVADIRNESVAQEPRPEIYYPYTQVPTRGLSLMLRARSAPTSLVEAARKAILGVDSNLAIATPRTVGELAAETFSATTSQSFLLGSFAAVALLLAVGGIYSVLSFTVASRAREIGIRIALGASALSIYRLVLSRDLRFVLLGMVVVFALALFGVRFSDGLLFEVEAMDPATFTGVTVLLLLAALLACLLPACRAAAIYPAVALRGE